MIDLKYLRENPNVVRASLRRRHQDVLVVDEILRLDENWRRLLAQQNALRAHQNRCSEAIALKKRHQEDVSAELESMKEVAQQVRGLGLTLKEEEDALKALLERIPNLLHESVPEGADDSQNIRVRAWSELPTFSFTPLAHWEIAPCTHPDVLGIIRSFRHRFVQQVGNPFEKRF
jgi:seryl-tRNA synthetase